MQAYVDHKFNFELNYIRNHIKIVNIISFSLWDFPNTGQKYMHLPWSVNFMAYGRHFSGTSTHVHVPTYINIIRHRLHFTTKDFGDSNSVRR